MRVRTWGCPTPVASAALFLVIGTMAFPICSGAQTADWQAVIALQPGVRVTAHIDRGVVGAEAVALEGISFSASAQSLTLRVPRRSVRRVAEGTALVRVYLSEQVSVEVDEVRMLDDDYGIVIGRDSVRTLDTATGAHRGMRGALVGGAVGYGLGVAVKVAIGSSEGEDDVFVSSLDGGLVLAPVGALVGYLLGRRQREQQVTYRRPAEQAIARVDPYALCLSLSRQRGLPREAIDGLQRAVCRVLADRAVAPEGR